MGHMLSIPETAVFMKNGHPYTNSQYVAEVFTKQHKDVLRSINNLDCSEEFAGRNFAPCSYMDGNNRARPMYNITKNGLIFLAMGFTGAQAAKFKEDYIYAFDMMEAAMHNPAPVMIEVAPTVTVNAVEQANKDAEFWKLKYELETSKREVEQLKRQIGGDDRYWFTAADDEKLICYKRQGLGKAKIHKLHPEWKEDSISSRLRKLRKDGKL